jgi:hypothetical protein
MSYRFEPRLCSPVKAEQRPQSYHYREKKLVAAKKAAAPAFVHYC